MSATTCRPKANGIARQLDHLGPVISADVLGPGQGPQPGMSIEIAIAETAVPTAVLDTLADHDADLVEATPQGPAMIAVAIV